MTKSAADVLAEVDASPPAATVFTKVEQLVSGGMTKADAFKQLAEEYGQPVNSVRGSYYQHTRGKNGEGKRRPRRRETTPEDALADARAALERAIESVDREVAVAKERPDLILIARPGLVSATLEETRQALLTLLQRAQILISSE